MEQTLTFASASADETRRIAAALAGTLGARDVVGLIGELGSGKTCFVEGACRALGYAGRVRSPSFTLLNIYRGSRPLYHFDLYRWDPGAHAAECAEWQELMDGDGVSFVEWADRGAELLPGHALILSLRYAGENARQLGLSAPPERAPALRAALAAWVAP